MNPTNPIISIIVILIIGLIIKEDTISKSVKIILCAIVSLVAYCALNIYTTEGFAGKKKSSNMQKKQSKKQSIVDQISPQSVQSIVDQSSQQVVEQVSQLKILISSIIPSGSIIVWRNKDNITSPVPPSGWVFCDGTNNTPDLRGRFVLGGNVNNQTGSTPAYSSDVDATREVKLGTNKINLTPPVTVTTNNHSHYGNMGAPARDSGNNGNTENCGPACKVTVTSIATSNNQTSINIMPPYYALAYIMKL